MQAPLVSQGCFGLLCEFAQLQPCCGRPGNGGTPPSTYFSSSRVRWSRASRGFPVRSSSCSLGGRFSGKVTSLSSLQLRSTHWRARADRERVRQRSDPTTPRGEAEPGGLIAPQSCSEAVRLLTSQEMWGADFAQCGLNFYSLWITPKKKFHALSSPHLYPSKFLSLHFKSITRKILMIVFLSADRSARLVWLWGLGLQHRKRTSYNNKQKHAKRGKGRVPLLKMGYFGTKKLVDDRLTGGPQTGCLLHAREKGLNPYGPRPAGTAHPNPPSSNSRLLSLRKQAQNESAGWSEHKTNKQNRTRGREGGTGWRWPVTGGKGKGVVKEQAHRAHGHGHQGGDWLTVGGRGAGRAEESKGG